VAYGARALVNEDAHTFFNFFCTLGCVLLWLRLMLLADEPPKK